MIFSRQPRGDNSQNARMPVARTDNNGGIALRIEGLRQLFFGFAADLFLNALSFAILLIEQRRQLRRFRFVLGEQELQSLFRGRETSRCIEPRPKPKADIFGGDRRTHGGDLHQFPHARTLGSRNFHDPR